MTQETKCPEAAHRLQEAIFEGLPETERADWHVAFAEKAETVKDWQTVIDKTVLASLRIAEPHDTSEGKVVAAVIALYERRLDGDNPDDAEWNAAAARAAARAARAALWGAWDDASDAPWAAARAAGAARDIAGDAAAAAAQADAGRYAWAEGAAARARAARAAAGDAAWIKIRDAFLNA